MTPTDANPVDIHVGRQILIFRTAAGLTQSELASHIGVSFQQLQKYERATNRVSASRLFAIAAALHRNVGDFFPEGDADGLASDLDLSPLMPLQAPWARMDAGSRRLVIDLAKSLADRTD